MKFEPRFFNVTNSETTSSIREVSIIRCMVISSINFSFFNNSKVLKNNIIIC